MFRETERPREFVNAEIAFWTCLVCRVRFMTPTCGGFVSYRVPNSTGSG